MGNVIFDKIYSTLLSTKLSDEKKLSLFLKMSLYHKKKILFDDRFSADFKTFLVTGWFNKLYYSEIDVHKYVLDSYIEAFKNGSKISLLIFADIME